MQNKELLTVMELKMSQLFIPKEGYQRLIQKKHVDKIVKGFDPNRFEVLKVSMRGNGRFAVVDGQHRFLAAQKLGFETVLCQVIQTKNSVQEASAFIECNTSSRKLNRSDILRANIHRGDERSVAMIKIAEKNGYEFSESSSANKISCVYACERITAMGDYGLDLFDKTLQIIKTAWNGRKRALDGKIITGLSCFLHSAKLASVEIDLRGLIGRIAPRSPEEAIAHSGLSSIFNNSIGTAAFFMEVYNNKLRVQNRVKFPLIGLPKQK